MRLIVFILLLVVAIGLWILGAPAWLVFLVALAAWAAFYFLLYPKVRSYKEAMGFDDQLNSWEATGWECLRLRLSGFKVMALTFLTSMVPFLGSAAEWLNGQKLDFFFDPNNPARQQTVMFVIGAIVFAAPFAVSWLHTATAVKAAETVPKQASPET